MAQNKPLHRPCVERMVPYKPGKPIDEVRREFGLERIIKLASNENPLGPSPLAIEAMERAVREVRLYPDDGCFYLTRKLAEHWNVPEEWIVVGRGSDEVIHLLGLAFLNPGEEVIMAEPPFALYPATATAMDCVQVRIPLKDHVHDLEAMASAITPKTKLIFISNPDNPTGTIVVREELEQFLDRVPETCITVLDEAYYEYVDDPRYPDSLHYVREGRNVVVLRTFSKIYALAGLRVGYGIIPAHLVEAVRKMRPPFNVSNVGQAAALASLGDPEQVRRGREVNAAGRAYLFEQFRRLGLRAVPTQANFVWVDLGVDCVAAFEQLLRRGVIVRTGDIFGAPTFARVTIGTQEENEIFISALEQVLEQLR